MTTKRRSRRGFTLLELCVVLAVILILGAVVGPTMFAMKGNTRTKAGADMIRGRMAEARAKAMEDGKPYRLAIASDGTKVRLAPDTLEATGMMPTHDDENSGPLVREDDLPEKVAAHVVFDENDMTTQDKEGWVRVATFLPDGTCKEDTVEVEIKEPGSTPYIVRLRGLTGAVTILHGLVGALK